VLGEPLERQIDGNAESTDGRPTFSAIVAFFGSSTTSP
jgi:hypothetical protein